MKVFKILGISFFIIVLSISIIGYFLPEHWKVERSIVINAPAEKIYPFIANFKTGWKQWSAFDSEDKNIQYTYSGPDEGVGAHREWKSEQMGDGNMTITKADPQKGVEFELLMKDTKSKITGRVDLESQANATKVTWMDEGDTGTNPLMKIMGQLMDKVMGESFEKSLLTLKQKVEAAP